MMLFQLSGLCFHCMIRTTYHDAFKYARLYIYVLLLYVDYLYTYLLSDFILIDSHLYNVWEL